MRKKNNKTILGVVIVIIAIASLFYFLPVKDSGDTLFLTIALLDQELPNEVVLDFCVNESGCQSYFSAKGMPEGYYENMGYNINCENGNCKLIKN